MEKILNSFIFSFFEIDWALEEENIGFKLGIYGREIYEQYKKQFDIKISQTQVITDIRSNVEDLFDPVVDKTRIMFALIYLCLVSMKNIDKKEMVINEVMRTFIDCIYPHLEKNKDIINYFEYRKTMNSTKKILRIL